MLSRCCFPVTVASRFEIVDEEYIEEKTRAKMKTRRKEQSAGGTFSISGRMKETFEDHESEVLDQTLSQFYTFRNSVILASLLLTSNSMVGGKIKG